MRRALSVVASVTPMERLARLVVRRKFSVIGLWLILVVAGMAAAANLSDRWFQSFSIPGFSAYEANQRIVKTFGSGEQAPLVVVLTSPTGDITQVGGAQTGDRGRGGAARHKGRVGSWFETKDDMYVSQDRHTMVATLYPAGQATFSSLPPIEKMRAALQKAAPAGVTAHLTGQDAIFQSQGGDNGSGVLFETLLGALGALIILLFVFGTLPAVLMPLLMAAASILTTFLCIYGLTYVTDVSIIVQFLVALVGLGVAIDYALLMIFRFREELSHGETTEEAIVQTMQHAGPLGDRLGLDGRDRPAQHDPAAAAVHPLDRDRRDADPRRLRCSPRSRCCPRCWPSSAARSTASA